MLGSGLDGPHGTVVGGHHYHETILSDQLEPLTYSEAAHFHRLSRFNVLHGPRGDLIMQISKEELY